VSLNSPATLTGSNFNCPGSGELHTEISERYGSIKRTDGGLMDDYGLAYNSNFNFVDFDMKKHLEDGTLSGGDVM
jgi:hypothetical protein